MTRSNGEPVEPGPERGMGAQGETVEGGSPSDEPASRLGRVPLFFAHPSEFDSPEEMAAAIHQAIMESGQLSDEEE